MNRWVNRWMNGRVNGRRRVVCLGGLVGWLFPAALRAADDMQFALDPTQPTFDPAAPVLLTWTLTNRTSQAWQVLSSEPDCDAVTLQIAASDGGAARQLQLSLPRAAFRPEFVVLAAGATVRHQFDLRAFTSVFGIPLGPGRHTVGGTYSVARLGYQPATRDVPLWRDTAVALPARFTITPKP
jgi:hypothetical protein